MVARAPTEPIEVWDADRSCPYAQRVLLALLEKGLPHVIHKVDLTNRPEDFKALYASINPSPSASAKVPILLDGDVKLVESLVTAEYLDAAYPASGTRLVPTDAGDAARVRLFVELVSAEVLPITIRILRAPDQTAVDEGRAALVAALVTIDKLLTLHGREEGGAFFLGPEFSLAEVGTLSFFQRAEAILLHYRDIDIHKIIKGEKLHRLERWLAAALARPSAVATRPTDQHIVDSWRKHLVYRPHD